MLYISIELFITSGEETVGELKIWWMMKFKLVRYTYIAVGGTFIPTDKVNILKLYKYKISIYSNLLVQLKLILHYTFTRNTLHLDKELIKKYTLIHCYSTHRRTQQHGVHNMGPNKCVHVHIRPNKCAPNKCAVFKLLWYSATETQPKRQSGETQRFILIKGIAKKNTSSQYENLVWLYIKLNTHYDLIVYKT